MNIENPRKNKSSFEINPLLLEEKATIESFNSTDEYNLKIEHSFHFFMHHMRSQLENYKNLKDEDREKAKNFIIDSLNLLKTKADEFKEYAEKNRSKSPVILPESAKEDYGMLHKIAVGEGIIVE